MAISLITIRSCSHMKVNNCSSFMLSNRDINPSFPTMKIDPQLWAEGELLFAVDVISERPVSKIPRRYLSAPRLSRHRCRGVLISNSRVQSVTAAVRAVMVPLAGTFLVSNGDKMLVRCGNPLVPVLPRTV